MPKWSITHKWLRVKVSCGCGADIIMSNEHTNANANQRFSLSKIKAMLTFLLVTKANLDCGSLNYKLLGILYGFHAKINSRLTFKVTRWSSVRYKSDWANLIMSTYHTSLQSMNNSKDVTNMVAVGQTYDKKCIRLSEFLNERFFIYKMFR